ncbi:uncharacterized protein LOC132735684 [Ruditapes philippinarum]|uniref:uncharacterized protein LOC132735684 n=1 Tax=Ruditapes philippinarum TaxID=129788 RepID=UPI00295B796F|nr:uncharacterized protein LOC132735684 [Ruditapes philippinarum]
MITMFVVCGLLFIIDGVYSMYILDNMEIPEKPCNIIPANSSLPCREFVITESRYCDENELRKLFSHLYNRTNPDSINWPAKVQSLETTNSSTEWTVSPNGNVNFLKGFQVRQFGNSYDNFLKKMCSVIDLSDMKASDLILLMKTKFYVNNSDAGGFDVEIKPLPFPPDQYQSTGVIETMDGNEKLNEYHSDINVYIDCNQLNATSVNISVQVSGKTKAIDYMEIMILNNQNREYLQNAQKLFYLSENFFVVNDLILGNYTLKLTPIETNVGIGDDNSCICYFGTNESRQCEPCVGYTKTIYVTKWTETLTEDDSLVGLILAPVLVTLLVVIIALSIWFVWYKNIIPSCINLPEIFRKRQHTDFTSIADDQQTKKPTIHIIQTSDHSSHKTAVESLENLIKTTTNYIVVADDNIPTGTSLTSANFEESAVEKIPDNVDVVCIIHSEWAQKLLTIIGSGEVIATDLANAMDRKFLMFVNEVCQNPAITSKFVSVRFEYTLDSAVIREPFLGPQFNLPTNTEAFIKHLHSRMNSTNSNAVNINTDDKMALFSAINAAFVYQNKHKSWLFTKLFHLRNSPSSDDSGIYLRRTRTTHSRSIRSRSAETISYHSCTCDINSTQTMCNTCYQRQSSRLRTHSCDLSFFPPESIVDGTSERLSLLENKFEDINRLYIQTLDLKGSEGDCVTLDGQSV